MECSVLKGSYYVYNGERPHFVGRGARIANPRALILVPLTCHDIEAAFALSTLL
jgi:hypothetical protein